MRDEPWRRRCHRRPVWKLGGARGGTRGARRPCRWLGDAGPAWTGWHPWRHIRRTSSLLEHAADEPLALYVGLTAAVEASGLRLCDALRLALATVRVVLAGHDRERVQEHAVHSVQQAVRSFVSGGAAAIQLVGKVQRHHADALSSQPQLHRSGTLGCGGLMRPRDKAASTSGHWGTPSRSGTCARGSLQWPRGEPAGACKGPCSGAVFWGHERP